jgi:hypothetical protein
VKSTLVGLGIGYGLFGFYGIYSVTQANLACGVWLSFSNNYATRLFGMTSSRSLLCWSCC